MAYADLATIQTTDPGDPLTAAWCDQVRDNDEFLIDPPACSISNAAVSTSSGVLVALGVTSTENFDNDAMHSTVSNRTRITIQTAGRYLFLGNASTDTFVGAINGFMRVSFRIDGTTAVGGTQLKNSTGNEAVRLTAARSLVLAAGQFVEMTSQQTLGTVEVTLDEFVAIFLTR